MSFTVRPLRIEPALDEREQIREMFARPASYRAVAAYAPEGLVDETQEAGERSVLPWFRGNWAAAGQPLVEGAAAILHNRRFLEAAQAMVGTALVYPEFVVVNVNAPMPAGSIHMDTPSFRGARRGNYPLPFLRVMGRSGLFEAWRLVRISAITWFYDGPGGNFDYWPEGLDGPMVSEQPPFGNVALVAAGDRMYHRIGRIGDPTTDLPRMSASAEIQPTGDGYWTILENGEARATYPDRAIRLSILWYAEVRDSELSVDMLTLDRIVGIFAAELRRRSVDFQIPSDPLSDRAWILLLQQVFAPPETAGRTPQAPSGLPFGAGLHTKTAPL
jgi:hypothetical protein